MIESVNDFVYVSDGSVFDLTTLIKLFSNTDQLKCLLIELKLQELTLVGLEPRTFEFLPLFFARSPTR